MVTINTKQEWEIGDCLKLLPDIPDKSIDMILCDLPYGVTQCEWDIVIPFNPLWTQYKRIIKDNGAIVLTATQPFTSMLIISNLPMFKYCWIWNKSNVTNVLNAKKQPLRNYEDVVVFYKNQPTYNPVNVKACYKRTSTGNSGNGSSNNYGAVKVGSYTQTDTGFPKQVIKFASVMDTIHPTQKPVPLFEYLIKTYTNPGDTILDNCLGAGTTLEACMNLNRNCIGFEISDEWEWNYRKILDKKKNMFKMSNMFGVDLSQ